MLTIMHSIVRRDYYWVMSVVSGKELIIYLSTSSSCLPLMVSWRLLSIHENVSKWHFSLIQQTKFTTVVATPALEGDARLATSS